MAWVWYAIGGILAVIILYIVLKHQSKLVDAIVSVAPSITTGLHKIAEWIDHNPQRESFVERITYYAMIATRAVEQSYKKLKAEKKRMYEDGKITKEELEEFYKKLKLEAMNIVKDLAQADGYQLDEWADSIISNVIEATVFFLPKEEISRWAG